MIRISKVIHKPSTALFPLPTVLVTSTLEGSAPNIITIAWTGIMCTEPPIVYIGVNPTRYSYNIIKESGEYVINIPAAEQVKEVDFCGIVSGAKVDKFKETGLTTFPATHVLAPLIVECPVNIECKVRQIITLGSNDAFIAEILAVHYNEDVLDEKGRPDIDLIRPFSYNLRDYRPLANKIGSFGFTKKR